MKTQKILLVVIFLFLCNTFLFPQEALKQGVYSLSGSVSLSYSENTVSPINSPYYTLGKTHTKQTDFSMAPSISYFVLDNLSVGGGISYFYGEMKYSVDNSNTTYPRYITRSFGIGPSIRYYFSGNPVVPFIGVNDFYSKYISGTDQEGNRFTAEGGIDCFLSKSVALEPFLSYTLQSINKPDQTTDTFSLGIRLNYFIIK